MIKDRVAEIYWLNIFLILNLIVIFISKKYPVSSMYLTHTVLQSAIKCTTFRFVELEACCFVDVSKICVPNVNQTEADLQKTVLICKKMAASYLLRIATGYLGRIAFQINNIYDNFSRIR